MSLRCPKITLRLIPVIQRHLYGAPRVTTVHRGATGDHYGAPRATMVRRGATGDHYGAPRATMVGRGATVDHYSPVSLQVFTVLLLFVAALPRFYYGVATVDYGGATISLCTHNDQPRDPTLFSLCFSFSATGSNEIGPSPFCLLHIQLQLPVKQVYSLFR